MNIGKFRLNTINLEFLINEAWKSKKSLAIKYKGTMFENYIELISKPEENLVADIHVSSGSFKTKGEFNRYIENCLSKA
ncbi:MAG: hypothetical protein ACRC3Y_15150 [Romboutsia sp.]|uniref:hypothetical protein n=1 Tax=Romboutsia sp. TaxID=1965302 RepID=UPI003F2B9257